jgi:hypothetical protein
VLLTASPVVSLHLRNTHAVCVVRLQQPDVSELQQVLQPVGQHMLEASTAADNRRSAAFNQLKVVAEALHGLTWLAYTGPNCGEHGVGTRLGGRRPATASFALAHPASVQCQGAVAKAVCKAQLQKPCVKRSCRKLRVLNVGAFVLRGFVVHVQACTLLRSTYQSAGTLLSSLPTSCSRTSGVWMTGRLPGPRDSR